jgi:hypothetical protein
MSSPRPLACITRILPLMPPEIRDSAIIPKVFRVSTREELSPSLLTDKGTLECLPLPITTRSPAFFRDWPISCQAWLRQSATRLVVVTSTNTTRFAKAFRRESRSVCRSVVSFIVVAYKVFISTVLESCSLLALLLIIPADLVVTLGVFKVRLDVIK